MDGPLSGTGDKIYYRYDTLGRKTWEIGRANAAGVRVAKRFTYRDADDKVTKVEVGTMTERYIHGVGEDDPLAWFDGAALGGSWSNVHLAKPDHQGSLTQR